MRATERKVATAARGLQSVLYIVIPQYRSETSKAPYRFIITARGYYADGSQGIRASAKIYNTYGPSGVNLGDVL
jgi:hypothetical protein